MNNLSEITTARPALDLSSENKVAVEDDVALLEFLV